MLQIDWTKENRDPKRNLYTKSITDKDNPLNRFLRGWDSYLQGHGRFSDGVSVNWQHLGAHHASMKGGAPIHERKAIYVKLLEEFLYRNKKTSRWTDQERDTAMKVARSAIIGQAGGGQKS